LSAFTLTLTCQVALLRYHRVSRNSAALIFPSVKHFLLQAFPFDVIQHHRIPHVKLLAKPRHETALSQNTSMTLNASAMTIHPIINGRDQSTSDARLAKRLNVNVQYSPPIASLICSISLG
jgi:hypothetical protein